MYARLKRAQAGQPQPSSSGPWSRAKRALRRLRRPSQRERAARAGGPGRQHAVEHVDAARDHLDHALGVADAHEVARLAGGQERGGAPASPRTSARVLLADAEAADRVAVEVERARAPPLERRRSSASRPPCVIAKRSWPGRARQVALRAAPRASCGARRSSSSARGTPAGGQMSRHIAMSEPRLLAGSRAASSGVKRCGAAVVDRAERDAVVVGPRAACRAGRRPGSRRSR